MPSASQLSELLLTLYAAPAGPANWSEVLTLVTKYLGLHGAALISNDAADSRINLQATVGASPEANALYANYYWEKDVWRVPTQENVQISSAFGEELCSLADLKKTEFYHDFLLKHLDLRMYFGFVASRNERLFETVAVHERLHKYSARKETINRLKLVLPHLQSALLLRRKFIELEEASRDREGALHLIRWGIFLVDESGRCFFLNRAAEKFVSQGEGLVLRDGKLGASVPRESSQLQALIHRASKRPGAENAKGGAPLRISRRNRKPLQVFVSAFLPENLELGRRVVGTVVVMDPEEHPCSPVESVCGLYGLTATEARIAIALTQGHDLRRVCEQFSIAYHTGRAHLRNIFNKTGVRRQAELIALLVRTSSVFLEIQR